MSAVSAIVEATAVGLGSFVIAIGLLQNLI